ncbi:hypothetical protein CK203_037627 [Vitis vinifera]|uniref:Uncharacterized protein n=1 Tax=Vitis vinifera TaxID=29760 RepID=A0A438HKJ8_VITVI|nr:hypothetical protein CK203_037627 [Vitis vinifera]
MMTESSYTVGPSSHPSFTELPHTEIPSQISIRLTSLLDLSTSSKDLSVKRSVWINNRLQLSISNRVLSVLRVARRVSMRR